MLIGVLHKIVT